MKGEIESLTKEIGDRKENEMETSELKNRRTKIRNLVNRENRGKTHWHWR